MILNQIIFGKKAKDYESFENSEKPLRSIIKAISWRVLGTIDTLVISYFLTGKFILATAIASIDFITKLILYFFHERIWNKIKWGK